MELGKRATLPAGMVSETAGIVSKPAEKASEPGGSILEPAGGVLKPGGRPFAACWEARSLLSAGSRALQGGSRAL